MPGSVLCPVLVVLLLVMGAGQAVASEPACVVVGPSSVSTQAEFGAYSIPNPFGSPISVWAGNKSQSITIDGPLGFCARDPGLGLVQDCSTVRIDGLDLGRTSIHLQPKVALEPVVVSEPSVVVTIVLAQDSSVCI